MSFKFKTITKEDRHIAFQNAAQHQALNETVLEKDYWVCFVLNYLFSQSKWKDKLSFKGGTSLSKCYGLISRFSEDIDLILDWRTLGLSTNEPWEYRSQTQQSKFNERTNEKTVDFIRNKLIKTMSKDFAILMPTSFEALMDSIGKIEQDIHQLVSSSYKDS